MAVHDGGGYPASVYNLPFRQDERTRHACKCNPVEKTDKDQINQSWRGNSTKPINVESPTTHTSASGSDSHIFAGRFVIFSFT
ncbi:hypothetical protein ACFX15_019881 [Malus domestica]